MKESKVVKVWPLTDDGGGYKTWENKFGDTMYVFGVQFENGEAGATNTKSQSGPRFKVGEVASYEIEPASNPKHPKKVFYVDTDYTKPEGQQTSFKSDPAKNSSIEKQTALKASVEYYKERQNASINDVVTAATVFNAWLQGVQAASTLPVAQTEEEDDLPF